MARTNNLTNFLEDVAGAIKEKKGSGTNILAADFDTEIRNLPSQGTYQTKTVSITENGLHAVTPDIGYDAIEEVDITVDVPEKQLQTRSYTFTQNTITTLRPEIGYDGFREVGITVNMEPTILEKKDVNFYDYDGTLLYSYTLAELQALTTLPALPTVKSDSELIYQGWNWTLTNLKSMNHPNSVGAVVIPRDGGTKIHIELREGALSPYVTFTLNGTGLVDWGDGSSQETYTTTANTTKTINHTYDQAGSYVITVLAATQTTKITFSRSK